MSLGNRNPLPRDAPSLDPPIEEMQRMTELCARYALEHIRSLETRPSWDLAHYGSVQVYARWGGERCRQAAELAEGLERFGWTTGEAAALLQPCERR